MRLTALVPLACAVAAFILSMLCLFAGSKPDFLEDYAIVTLNTSTLGHDLFDNPSKAASATATTTSSAAASTATFSASYCARHPLICIENGIENVTATVTQELQSLESEVARIATEIQNELADKLADELGISQWYSLHLLDMCQGSYAPNATAPGAGKNGSSSTCSNKTALYHFDPISSLNDSLAQNRVLRGLNLTDVAWPDELTDGIHAVNGLSSATFIFYVLGIAFSGLAIITSLLAVFLHGSRLVSFGNFGIAALAFVFLGVASAIVTAVMVKVVDVVSEHGNDAGVYAYRGNKFLALTWASVGLMLVAMLAWVAEFCAGRRREKRVYTEKMTGSRGWKARF